MGTKADFYGNCVGCELSPTVRRWKVRWPVAKQSESRGFYNASKTCKGSMRWWGSLWAEGTKGAAWWRVVRSKAGGVLTVLFSNSFQFSSILLQLRDQHQMGFYSPLVLPDTVRYSRTTGNHRRGAVFEIFMKEVQAVPANR